MNTAAHVAVRTPGNDRIPRVGVPAGKAPKVTPCYGHTLLQSPVWKDPYVGTYRECKEKILVLTWWCFAEGPS